MSKAFLDVLHARQPKLDYLSPAICEYIFSGSGFSSFLLEEGWNDDPVSSATMVVYGIGGDHTLDWDPVVGAICYMVYVADDSDNPLTSTYTLIADCIDRPYNPPPTPPTCVGCPPPRPPCYTIQALTDAGLSPLSVPICPSPPPPSCPQCGGGGGSSELACFTDPGNVHAILNDSFAWTPTLVTPGAGTYVVSAGTLPPGLVIDAATGTVSGTPTLTGSFPLHIRITYTGGASGCTQAFTFIVAECITTANPLPDAYLDAPYTLDFAVPDPNPSGVFSIISGNLPVGFTLTSAGELSGIAEETGDFTFSVNYNVDGEDCVKEFDLHVGAACISTDGPLNTGMEGVAYSQTLSASAPQVGQEWTITSGFLPDSLTLNLNTGEISGIPDLGTAGDYAITVRLTNTDTTFCEESFSLTIVENDVVCITTGTILPSGQEGVAYSQTFVAANPEAGQLWTVSAGTIPDGLALIAATGELTGTPDTGDPGSAGVYNFTVKLTDLDTSFCEKAFTLTIAEQDIQNCPDFSQQGALSIVEELGFGYSITPPSGGPGASKSVALTSVGSATASVDWISPYDFSTDEGCDCQVQIQIAPTGDEATGYVFIYRNNVFVTGAVANDTDGSIDVTMPFTVPAGNHSLEVRVGAFISTGGPATSTTITYSLSIV